MDEIEQREAEMGGKSEKWKEKGVTGRKGRLYTCRRVGRVIFGKIFLKKIIFEKIFFEKIFSDVWLIH